MKIYFTAQTGEIRDGPPPGSAHRHYELPFEARGVVEAAIRKATETPVNVNYPSGFLSAVWRLEQAFKENGDWRTSLDSLKDVLDERIFYVGKPSDGDRRATVRGERSAKALAEKLGIAFELKETS